MESITSFEKLIMAELECPICISTMSPPIRRCERGHDFCKECFKKVDKCPKCRGPKAMCRNYGLENIYMIIKVPCRFSSNDCDFVDQGKLVLEHEKSCQFATKKCPFSESEVDLCSWSGLWRGLKNHCHVHHSQRMIYGAALEMSFDKFSDGMESSQRFDMIYAHRTLFMAYWYHNVDTGMVCFAVNGIMPEFEENRFSYEVTFFAGDTLLIAYTFKSFCILGDSEQDMLSGKYNFTVPFEQLRRCCSPDGHLHFLITIGDVNAEESQ